jgi:hypothetical protein
VAKPVLTKIFRQKHHADHVENKSDNLRDDHVDMPITISISRVINRKHRDVIPCCYFQCDHDELV